MASKKATKAILKFAKLLIVKAYHTILKDGADTIDPVVLTLTNGQDQYILGPIYKVIGDNIAFLFNKYANAMLLE